MTKRHLKENQPSLGPRDWTYASEMLPKASTTTAPTTATFDLEHAPPENFDGRLGWHIKRFGKQPHEWNAKDLQAWGYHHLEASRLAKSGQRDPDWKPTWITRKTRDRNHEYRHKQSDYEPLKLFPTLWHTWGRCLPAPDDNDGRKRLGHLLRSFCRASYAKFNDEEHCDKYDQGTEKDLFWCLHEALTGIGRKVWGFEDFLTELERQWDLLCEEEDKAEERRAEFKKEERKGKFGRPRSDLTDAIDLIVETIKCSNSHAYKVHHSGTTVHTHRVMLAKAFADDRRRNLPAHWEPAFGASKTRDPLSFRAYLESRTDQFEGNNTLSKTLDLLRRQAENGHLPDQIKDITELERVSYEANADTLLQVWKAYIAWRDAQQIKRPKGSPG